MIEALKLMLKYTKNLKVLYVEDDLDLITRTQELFEHYFLSLDIAHDGASGLEKYNAFYLEHNVYYDLVITDIIMPKMNGIEMSNKIYQYNTQQAIIVISAHNEIEHLSSIIDIGVSAFLAKPIQSEKLINTLFKVSRTIHDHKFVEEHIGQIEDLNIQLDEQNIQLERQNKELINKNLELEKSFRMLDTMVNKEQLVKSRHIPNSSAPMNTKHIYIEEQIEQLINDDLNELVEIHGEIDNHIIDILNNVHAVRMDTLEDLIELFEKYASTLSFYNFFDDLSSAMKDFTITLKNNALPENKEVVENLFMLLESFMYVLGKWQDDLRSGDKNKINSLDASIISDMKTITNMWIQKEEEVSEDILDDIFDF